MNNNNEAGTESCSTDEQDEMVATERELAEDAQWKRIQQNTFTRWANEHLKTVNKHIGNLETDLCDGLRLITLIEVLSGKRLPKHNKRPTFRSQKLENVSVALKFLEDDESIRIVNIGEYTQYWSWHFMLRQVCSNAALYKPRGHKGGVGKVPNTGEVAPIFIYVLVSCHCSGRRLVKWTSGKFWRLGRVPPNFGGHWFESYVVSNSSVWFIIFTGSLFRFMK